MTSLPFVPPGSSRVLVVSSNRVIRQKVLDRLRVRDCSMKHALGGADALSHLEQEYWPTLLLDRYLPDLDSDELAATVRLRFPGTEVLWLEGELDSKPALELKASVDESPMAEPAAAMSNLQHNHTPLPGMIGRSQSMLRVYRAVRLVAARNTTVLVEGPTGSGKELVARALHELSDRVERTFVTVNCAAIPESLLESELFGYSRGAFTGATQSYGGRVQAAQGGTLFLDEIGEMPLSLQPKLLRFLESKEIQRLGSCEAVRVDARVVAATNAQLEHLVRVGRFREDLYYRLATFPIAIPPLAERIDDVPMLARHFLENAWGRPPYPEFSRDAVQLLKAQTWPGNVRELQNVIERAVILVEGQPVIRPEHFAVCGR